MPSDIMVRQPFGNRPLRLETLIRLRWLAIAGQSVTLLGVRYGFGFELPLAPAFALVALSAWLNLFLSIRYSATQRLASHWAGALLAYDVLQLSGLLALTGGLHNPFAILLLAPVTVSATTQPPRQTVILGLLTAAAATAMAVFHLPLPWQPAGSLDLPFRYVMGILIALFCGLAFIGIYAFRVAEESRQLSDALAATELILAREQHLSALDGLAAAAAHELGTPLATITLVAKELGREMPAGSPYADDVALIAAQAERCREILKKLNSLGRDDGFSTRMPLTVMIEEICEPHREFGVDITTILPEGKGDAPVVTRNAGILYGLGNLVENAVDFAESRVEIRADWNDAEVSLAIIDDGPGFAPEVVDRLGDPYVTTRGRTGATVESGGLGLGLFIAKTLIERSGARMMFANRSAPEHGADIRVVWPRASFEARLGRPPPEGDESAGVASSAQPSPVHL